jgi:gluconolactonase
LEDNGDTMSLSSIPTEQSMRRSLSLLMLGAAASAGAQSVQYRSPAGVEYRAQADTGAIARATAALARDPRNVSLLIALGNAQAGVRQFREAIATYTRAIAIAPNDAMLYRWRGHRLLSVREFDRAYADLTRGFVLDSTNYGVLYHLGVVQMVRGEFAEAGATFARAQRHTPSAREQTGSTDWRWLALARAGRRAEADAQLSTAVDSVPTSYAYARRIRLYRGALSPDEFFTPADSDQVSIATLNYGLGSWWLVRGDTVRARTHFERSVAATEGWPAFAHNLSEVELRRLAPGARPAAAEPPETTTEAIPGVVKAGVRVRFIRGSFNGTEGPIGLPDGTAIFTETNANRLVRIDARDSVSSWLEETVGANGLAFDSRGRLIAAQTVAGKTGIRVIAPANARATLADAFEGRAFGRPNDLTVGRSGLVYFTDPGPNVPPGQTAPPGTLPPAVYLITPTGEVKRAADGIARPNGVLLSADERTLYVADSWGAYILAYDVARDGTLSNRRNFALVEGTRPRDGGGVVSGADGLAIDAAGRLYVAPNIGRGVQVFDRTGKALGTIPTPRSPQNIAFAGKGKQTLYIVGRGSAYRVALDAAGFAGRAK